MEKYWRVNLLGPGPRLMKNIIYRTAVSQRLINIDVQKIKTHILGPIISFFLKSCRLWDNVERYCANGWAWDNFTVHAHADYLSLRKTLVICNNYCFPAETVVTRTRLSITLYVHSLACFIYCQYTFTVSILLLSV